MILVVGSTGALGSAVVEKLLKADEKVAGLVRDPASPKARELHSGGMEVRCGDLAKPDSLTPALAGIDTVICTATAMLSRKPTDTIDTVDHQGVQSLISAAERNRVQHFIHVSYDTAGGTYPLAMAKRSAERRLFSSELQWTILQPAPFCESWFSPAAGFDVPAGHAHIYGNGNKPVHYVALEDVAKAVLLCLNRAAALRKVFRFGGGSSESQLDAVRLWEAATGKSFTCSYMSLAELGTARESARDPMASSVLGLCELLAKGIGVDSDVQSLLGLQPESVEDWIHRAAGKGWPLPR